MRRLWHSDRITRLFRCLLESGPLADVLFPVVGLFCWRMQCSSPGVAWRSTVNKCSLRKMAAHLLHSILYCKMFRAGVYSAFATCGCLPSTFFFDWPKLKSRRYAFWFGLFAFFVFLSVLFVLCFWCLFFVLHGDTSMDYVSIHFSSLLYHIVIMTNVATAWIRWICTMQLSFRLDKRPGETYLALDAGVMPHGRKGSKSCRRARNLKKKIRMRWTVTTSLQSHVSML